MELLRDILTAAFLFAGAGFLVIGGVGLLRMPDVFARMHPAGVTDTGGAALILCGLMLQGGLSLVTVKLGLILLFLWLTSPTATHTLAEAALRGGMQPQGAPRWEP